MLASNDPITGKSSLANYNQTRNPDEVRVVDLELKNLPEGADKLGVKKLSGAKQVINVNLDEDNFRGVCKGTGRIQIRLDRNENLEAIELAFA